MKKRLLSSLLAASMMMTATPLTAQALNATDDAGESPAEIATVESTGSISEPSAQLPAIESVPAVEIEEIAETREASDGVFEVDSVETLRQAVEAAEDGVETTIRLTQDISDMTTAQIITIPEDKNIVLDMNGRSITVDGNDFSGRPIVNNGTLTVTGNGTIDSSMANSAEAKTVGFGAIDNFGTLLIENGVYKGSVFGGAAIRNKGGASLTIEDGYFESNSAIYNFEDATAVINGGEFKSKACNAIKDDTGKGNYHAYAFISAGNLYFNEGKVTGVQGALAINNGYAEVKNGTFETVLCEHATNAAFYSLYIAGERGVVNAIISGGNFKSATRVAVNVGNDNTGGDGGLNLPANATITGGTFIGGGAGTAALEAPKTGTLNITGGAFSSDVTAYVDPSSDMKQDENGQWVATPIPASEGVAAIGDKYYATLADAVQAVVSSKDKTGTVTLLKNAAGGGIGLFNRKGAVKVNLTIDFGGFTYTCNDPAVGSEGTESQGFHLEKDNTVTLKNGTIKVSPDSKNTIMLIQNYCDLTLEDLNLYGSDATQYMISSNYGDTVLKNVNIDGTNKKLVAIDLMHWLGTGYANQAPTMQIKNDADNTIKGSIDVYCWDTRVAECPDKPNLTIYGGHYTVDPSAYLATDYAAAASDKDGYVYQVVKATNTPAKVVPEDPKVEVELPDHASDADKTLAESISIQLNKLVVDEDIVKAAAGTVASQNTVTVDEGKKALKQENIAVPGEAVTIVAQPYLDVTLTKATSGPQKDFTVDITPMYRTVATTNVDDIVVKGEATEVGPANAVVIGEPKELTINKTVEVSIPLPDGFTSDKTLYVHHQKNNVTYVYEGAVKDDTLTFTNPHGFSLFTITAAQPQAKIGDVNYATLQDAINAVENGGTIGLLATGSATVSREITFTITGKFKAEITAGSGYKLTQNSDTYTITEKSTSSGGASHPEAGSTSSSSDRYQIDKPSDVENGSIKVSDSKAEKGDTVTITVTPDEGYELDELAVYDEDGDKIDLKDKGDGKYTFEMPKGDVEIEVSFAAISDETLKANFTDVAADAWYADAVQYVYENGLMSGTSETTFSPDLTTTRGMIVTILYRMENEPAVTGTTAFTDVAADQYYANAVAWAAQNGIVAGIDAITFAPDKAITREQMAAILYRYAQFKGYDVSAKADLSVYTDAASVGAYAVDAMAWANGAGLITGTSATTLTPAGNATRAQVAAILMRFGENIAK